MRWTDNVLYDHLYRALDRTIIANPKISHNAKCLFFLSIYFPILGHLLSFGLLGTLNLEESELTEVTP